MFGGSFAPRGWQFCNGQLLAIAQNSALFSILGTTYGGNGQTTFGLPDLRSRFPIHSGMGQAGPGLTFRSLGESAGMEGTTLLLNQMPIHNHPISGTVTLPSCTTDGTAPAPAAGMHIGKVVDPSGTVTDINLYTSGTPDIQLGCGSNLQAAAVGGSQPVVLMNPFLAVNFIIATEGIYPSRN